MISDIVQALAEEKKAEVVETQMSWVMVGPEHTYKVKKPVDLGYLDYTTLEKREFFCHREVELNRRLCPEVYLGVIPIIEEEGKFYLDGKGRVAEYAVKMKSLPQEKMLDVLLTQDRVTPDMIDEVAQKVAYFHEHSSVSDTIRSFGGLEVIRHNTQENFLQTQKYIGVSILEHQYRKIKEWTEGFMEQNVPLFERRVRQERIKDGHGDLHAAHVCFDQEIVIFDCIEFNDRFRYGDVASEIAFLAMDLDHFGKPSLASQFVSSYQELTLDHDLSSILNFYRCYRAYVRGKVNSFRLDDASLPPEDRDRIKAEAKGYFSLALSYVG
jgi:hypothetical protein